MKRKQQQKIGVKPIFAVFIELKRKRIFSKKREMTRRNIGRKGKRERSRGRIEGEGCRPRRPKK